MTNYELLSKENLDLMKQYQILDMSKDENKEKERELRDKINSNAQDMKAYAVALGNKNETSRIFNNRKANVHAKK